MEIISKISRGSKMDQIYIPKNRKNFTIGTYVVIRPLETEQNIEKPYFYNISSIEPVKLDIINEIFNRIEKISKYENIIITGSFLDDGFNFNDIDILIISDNKIDEKYIKKVIENTIKIKAHIITLNNKSIGMGLSTDPLYQMMLSKCIAKKRFIYKTKRKIDYKLLDLHLLKSKSLTDGYDFISGIEKYYLTRNMIAISLFIQTKKIDKKRIDEEIKRIFNIKKIQDLKQNMLDKKTFLQRYNSFYNNLSSKILSNIQDGAKQKQAH